MVYLFLLHLTIFHAAVLFLMEVVAHDQQKDTQVQYQKDYTLSQKPLFFSITAGNRKRCHCMGLKTKK